MHSNYTQFAYAAQVGGGIAGGGRTMPRGAPPAPNGRDRGDFGDLPI